MKEIRPTTWFPPDLLQWWRVTWSCKLDNIFSYPSWFWLWYFITTTELLRDLRIVKPYSLGWWVLHLENPGRFLSLWFSLYICIFVCMCEYCICACISVCVYTCVRERERESVCAVVCFVLVLLSWPAKHSLQNYSTCSGVTLGLNQIGLDLMILLLHLPW